MAVDGHEAGTVFPIKSDSSCWGHADRSRWRIASPSGTTPSGRGRDDPVGAGDDAFTVAAIWILSQPMDMRAVGFLG